MSNYGHLYLPMQSIKVPKHNDARLIFTVRDEEGQLVDISGAEEIVFAVWDVPKELGGAVQFSKTLTDGDITIHGNGYKFTVWVFRNESGALTKRLNYFECDILNDDPANENGSKRTVAAGLFRAENTSNWSIE
jgi:hypothetical protein